MPASHAEVIAVRLSQPADTNGFPVEEQWQRTEPVSYCHDWQGKNEDPLRNTDVRVLWADDRIYLRFRCQYRSIHVFPDADSSGRRNELWDRDVAEVFLQADRFGEKYYKEFEVSPNGQWLDLDITPQGLKHVASGMRTRVALNEAGRRWTADIAIPMVAITSAFDPAESWRANFFRCEGLDPERFYSAWQPTETEKPNFHVPQKFGWMRFES